MTAAEPHVDAETLMAMENCLGALLDMAALSRTVFERFLEDFPNEAPRFINLDAAILRMTDETFVLMLGLAQGEGWARTGAAHWVDLHRNYGPIATPLYLAWIGLCVDGLRAASGAAWTAEAERGWVAAADELKRLCAAANS